MNDAGGESNHAAYAAVGAWHEFQVTGDEAFAARMWPAVRRAIGFALSPADAAGRDHLAARGRRDARPATRC